MKQGFGMLVLIVVALSASVAKAGHFHRDGCSLILERCKMDSRATAAQCQTLFDMAVKAGGEWGAPDAREATKTSGRSFSCLTE